MARIEAGPADQGLLQRVGVVQLTDSRAGGEAEERETHELHRAGGDDVFPQVTGYLGKPFRSLVVGKIGVLQGGCRDREDLRAMLAEPDGLLVAFPLVRAGVIGLATKDRHLAARETAPIMHALPAADTQPVTDPSWWDTKTLCLLE
jgi:hypothetical protein